MTFTFTDLKPRAVTFLRRYWLVEEGAGEFFVPNDPAYKYMIVKGQGCGGMGESYGGGGELTIEKAPVTPGEKLLWQIGRVSTASVLGDTFLKRSNNQIIIYCDRGRGNGAGGLAANSTGAVKRSGNAGTAGQQSQWGAPGSDLTDPLTLGLGGYGYYPAQVLYQQGADHGGGGRLLPGYNSDGTFAGGYVSDGAGSGVISMEFCDGDPGPLV